jgi:K+-sensing histidine kinase KdpD
LLPTIFDPLVRATDVRGAAALQKQRRPGSIGLGLYIARAVVNAHGGSIDRDVVARGRDRLHRATAALAPSPEAAASAAR